ncbi:MAG: hydroxymethylbilane synthase [Nitrospiraceae bacterium]|nr:hydroxymethylbilane synthase [Nitrospiraceae bacterium]
MTTATEASRSSVVIGTRGSQLAVWQAEWVQARLQEIAPDVTINLKRIKTSGDKILDVPLATMGGKGLFVKEIEEAMLQGDIDLAVHSMKDVPTELPAALEIICIPAREDARDVLISRDRSPLERLAHGARIGTSSLRRQAQLLCHRPDLRIEMLRGNLDTRLRKLREGGYEAIVLAAAGLRRMGWEDEITEYFPFTVSLPAIGQGALGLEGRRDDTFVRKLVSGLDHLPTRTTVTAERSLLDRLQGGCQVPIAAHAVIQQDRLFMDGLIASIDGRRVVRGSIQGSISDARSLGIELAEKLLADGGEFILNEIYGRA